MPSSWQDVVAVSLVLVAACHLVRRVWLQRVVTRTTGCTSGCHGCPAGGVDAARATTGSGARRAASPGIPMPPRIFPIEGLQVKSGRRDN